jgi:hypothetical protein
MTETERIDFLSAVGIARRYKQNVTKLPWAKLPPIYKFTEHVWKTMSKSERWTLLREITPTKIFYLPEMRWEMIPADVQQTLAHYLEKALVCFREIQEVQKTTLRSDKTLEYVITADCGHTVQGSLPLTQQTVELLDLGDLTRRKVLLDEKSWVVCKRCLNDQDWTFKDQKSESERLLCE